MREGNTFVQFMISDEDKAKLRERMKAAGMVNMSAYIRKMALNGYVIVLDLSDVHELLRLLRINSNNLNQYAKKANTTGSIYKEDIQKLQSQQKEIWNEMGNIVSRLANIQ